MTRRSARFVNRTWPWLPLALLALALLRAGASIATEKPAGDVTRINNAVHDYAIAALGSRGADACRRLTPHAQDEVTGPVGGGLSCGLALRSFGAPFPAGTLQNVILRNIVIRGDRATVGPADVLRGDRVPAGLALSFQKVSGDWRLDGVTQAPARPRAPAKAAARP